MELHVMVFYISILLLLVSHICHERNEHTYMRAFGVPPPNCVPSCVQSPNTNQSCCCEW
ncbi:hypothetical protein HanIR_Chr17g0896591 [Helianthus annuus]|nr:hypothetical protein HanIR_Chr17g0896591 [Helianthus annuus]